MTTNTTQLAIDCTLVLLETRHHGFDTARSPAARAARERLSGTLPIALGFVLGTCCGAAGYAVAHFATLLLPVGICYALLVWTLSASRRLAS